MYLLSSHLRHLCLSLLLVFITLYFVLHNLARLLSFLSSYLSLFFFCWFFYPLLSSPLYSSSLVSLLSVLPSFPLISSPHISSLLIAFSSPLLATASSPPAAPPHTWAGRWRRKTNATIILGGLSRRSERRGGGVCMYVCV